MTKLLIITKDKQIEQSFLEAFSKGDYELKIVEYEENIIDIANNFIPEIAVIDDSYSNTDIQNICNKLKFYSQANDIQILLLTDGDSYTQDPLAKIDGYLLRPINKKIAVATINAHMRTRNRLDMIFNKTSELAKSLYQLNVMYDTSSQLAGTLDKTKLINIMTEGLERSISYSLCAVLIFNDESDIKLIIHSLNPVSERLEQALKLRMMINYKNLFENQKQPLDFSINNIHIKKQSKHTDGIYDLKILNYDTLFCPINTSDKFFGLIEVFREDKLTSEDFTCFQTLVKQVSLPLESALLYEEITKTNKKLEKLEQLKSEFISIVSHELRTPLTAIKNSLNIMLSGKSGEMNETSTKFLNLANRNVNRLSGIINDLLDLSKIEAGKMEYRFDEFNIKDPAEQVCATLEGLAKDKNISLEIKAEDNLPKVYGDSSKIEQVIANLIANAIKFTNEDGKIKVEIKKAKPEEISMKNALKGGYLQVAVEDNGIGIKQEDIPKVFDKFQQIESSLVRKIGGTGLGLPIAKQLIEGMIWVESELNHGSTFSFIIPIAKDINKFMMELDKQIQYAKYNHSNLALIRAEQQHTDELIKEIAQDSFGILQKYKNAQVFTQKKEDKNTAFIILPSANKMAADIIIQKLKDYIQSNKNNYLDYNIFMSSCIYPEGALSANELIEKTTKEHDKMKTEEKV